MLPSFNEISYFLEVAETHNISRAAERLGITQPSLSSAIRRLEDAMGCQLLTRSRSGVQLTKAGEEMVVKGRLLLLNWEQLRSEIGRGQTEVTGQYVIGCHPSVAMYSLPHFLPELLDSHLGLQVRLVHDLSRKITEEVISFQIDFGIVVNPIRHPDLVIKELCTDVVSFWVAKKKYPLQDLNNPNAVLICDSQLNQSQKLMNDLQKRKMTFRRTISSSHLEVITALTSAGAGIGLLPSRVATRSPGDGLVSLAGKLPIFKDKICLVYRSDAPKTAARQTIISSIRAAIKPS